MPAKPTTSRAKLFVTNRGKILATCLLGLVLFYFLLQPSLGRHLGIIKGVSLGIAGLCAVLNTWKKRHNQSGDLDDIGKGIVLLMILGGFTAVAAAYIEERKKEAASLAAQKSTETQLAQIKRVTAAVQRQQLQGQTILTGVQAQQNQNALVISNLDSQAYAAAKTIRNLERLLTPLPAPEIELTCRMAPGGPVPEVIMSL